MKTLCCTHNIHIRKLMHTHNIHTHKLMHIHTCIWTCSHMYTYIQLPGTHMPMCTHTDAYKHTYTHTHTSI